MKTTPVSSPLRNWKLVSGAALVSACMTVVGCGSNGAPISIGGPGTPVPAGPHTLTVNSTDPTSNVAITASPADANAVGGGNSTFSLSYADGTDVTLTAPVTAPSPAANAKGPELFDHWSGCITSLGSACTVKMQSDLTVTAVYRSQVTVSLQASTGTQLLVGTGQQIYLTITGTDVPDLTVTWSVTGPAGYTGDLGSINQSNGFYQSPYPAPAYVVITATSNFDPVASASITIQLGSPAVSIGPALTVDTSAVTHPISPLIYGINQFGATPALQSVLASPLDRWGGDASTRYNYLLDQYNSGADYFYETNANTNTKYPDTSLVNSQIAQDKQYGALSMITVPLIGFTTQSPGTGAAERAFACGFSITKYGAQQSDDANHTDCGNGETPSGFPPINWGAPVVVGGATVSTGYKQVTDPADTSVPASEPFVTNWVQYLVGKFGTAANGGVGIYELDNEPEFWNGQHADVHPAWMTYDELTNKGISYATAIKTADPSALVSGPVISNWNNYFYSTADEWVGYNSNGGNNCYCYNAYAADRENHNFQPLLAYYLQQMQAAETSGGKRLLDYFDLHGYFAANGAQFALAGDTALQEAREDSTRALWDPNYLDSRFLDPNKYQNASNPIAVELIPFMKNLVASNYPGTKTAITEYNWGGMESMSGAIAQAEALAIFGWQGLDMAAVWDPPSPDTHPTFTPGLNAFNFFLNYDGAGSKFGDGSLNTNTIINGTDPTSGQPTTTFGGGQVAIYAAKRSSDGAITVILFNKTYAPETTSLVMTTAATSAKVFQLSQANLAAIVPQADATVTQASGNGTVSLSLPAQSITLLVFAQ